MPNEIGVQTPGGEIIYFPENTDRAVIDGVMRQRHEQVKQSQTADAAASAVGNASAIPAQAARSISLGNKLNLPPLAVEEDIPSAEEQARQVAAGRAAENPLIAKYINANPSSARVSANDWDKLIEASPATKTLAAVNSSANRSYGGILSLGIAEGMEGFGKSFARGVGYFAGSDLGKDIGKPKQILDSDDEYIKGLKIEYNQQLLKDQQALTKEQRESLVYNIGHVSGGLIASLPLVVAGVPGLALGQGISSMGATVEDAETKGATPEQIADAATASFVMNTALGAVQFQRLHTLVKAMPAGFSARILSALGTAGLFAGIGEVGKFGQSLIAKYIYDPQAKYEFNPTETAASGIVGGLLGGALVSRPAPRTKFTETTIQANLSAKALDDAVKAAGETETKQLSPEQYESYMISHGVEGEVMLSPERVLELYDAAGKSLNDPRGPLGWLPGAEKIIQEASVFGTEIPIPIEKYVSNIDPKIHEALREDIRTGEDGVTLNEVKEGLKELPQKEQKFVERETARIDLSEDTPKPAFVQEVVRRLQEAIEEEESSKGLRPIFTEAPPEVSKVAFSQYQKRISEQLQLTKEHAIEVTETYFRRKLTPEWKKEFEQTVNEARIDLANRPDIAVDIFLRTGKLPSGEILEGSTKLSREIVERLVPAEAEALKKYTSKNGLDPDLVGPLFGFTDGTTMLNSVRGLLAQREEAGRSPLAFLEVISKEEANARMEAKYGTLQELIEDKAKEAVAKSASPELMATEMQMLANAAGKSTPHTADSIRDFVSQAFDKQLASVVLSPKNYERALLKAWKALEKALLKAKPNYIEAFNARQQQLLNTLLLAASKDFIKTTKKLKGGIDFIIGPDSGKLMNRQVLELSRDMLEKFGIKSDYATDGNYGTLADWVDARKALYGDGPEIADWILHSAGKPLKDFTAGEIKDLSSAVNSLIHVGREDAKTAKLYGKASFEEAIAEIANSVDDLRGKFNPQEKSLARGIVSELVRPERMIDWLDKNNPHGLLNKMVFRPITEGKYKKTDLIRAIKDDFLKIPSAFSWRKSLRDTIPSDDLRKLTNKLPENLSRENLIMLAMNTGTESNLRVLAHGYGLDPKVVQSFVDKNMRKADWDFVRGVWDIYEKHLKGGVEKLALELQGNPLTKLASIDRKITTADGQSIEISGKYYPLDKDRYAAIIGDKQQGDRFDTRFFNTIPDTRALHARTGAVYPLRLDMENIPNLIDETAHTIAYRTAIGNATKVFNDPKIREAISGAFGPESLMQFNNWLDFISTNGGRNDMSTIGNLLSATRTNSQVLLIGWNLVTGMLHGSGALANSIETVGPKQFTKAAFQLLGNNYALAMDKFMASPPARERMIREAYAQSGEVRNRMHYVDDNFDWVLTKIRTASGMTEIAKEAFKGKMNPFRGADWGMAGEAFNNSRIAFIQNSMQVVAKLDQASAVPVFIAARDAALKSGQNLQDAIYAGDKAVRNAHGSAGITDIPGVMRNRNLRYVLMFHNYFNHVFNQMADTSVTLAKQLPIDRGRSAAKFAFDRTVWYLFAGALAHEVFRGHSGEDDSWAGWLGKAVLGQGLNMLPFVGQLWYSLDSGFKLQGSPVFQALESPINLIKDVKAYFIEGKSPKKAVQHTLEALAPIGVSSRQVSRGGQFLYDLSQGEQEAEGPVDLTRGLLYGKSQPKH